MNLVSANLHAYLHVGEVGVRHLSRHQLPQEDSEAPHVCGATVDFLWFLLQSWRE